MPWYQRLVLKFYPKDYGHVLLLNPVTDHHALLIQPINHSIHIELREFEHSVATEAARLAQQAHVYSFINKPDTSKHLSNLVPSCVSAVKLIMGVSCPAVTPKGLSKWLAHNGAQKL